MAQKYRLSEIFYSIQGEGRYAGTPTLWARVFGCNLKCPGFPCDTEYSWNKDFKDEHSTYTAQEIFEKMKSMITDEFNSGTLEHALTKNFIHLAFTGGEPMLKKYQPMIMEVVDLFAAENEHVMFTIETNGTQPPTEEFVIWLNRDRIWPFFSISPKLETVAGEKDAVNYKNITNLLYNFGGQVKIVANNTDECLQEVLQVVNKLDIPNESLWIMPKGETKEDQLNVAPIVERYQQLGFKIATRNHCYIWSNDKNR